MTISVHLQNDVKFLSKFQTLTFGVAIFQPIRVVVDDFYLSPLAQHLRERFDPMMNSNLEFSGTGQLSTCT